MTEQPYPTAPPPTQQATNGMAIGALVCGILSLLLWWIPFINILAIILGLVAIILGALGMRRANEPYVGGKGLAIAGLVTGILGLLASVVVLFGSIAFFAGLADNPDVQRELERAASEANAQGTP